jgi:hypothetical protein
LAAEILEGTALEGFAKLEADGCDFEDLDLLLFR